MTTGMGGAARSGYRFDAAVARRALFALALAILLWGWVTNLEDPETRRTFTVTPMVMPRADAGAGALTIIDEGRLPAATIELRGPRSIVNRLEPGDLHLVVDLGRASTPGTIDLPLTVRGLPRNVRVASIAPATVTVTVDRLISKSFPLEPEPATAPPPLSIGRVVPAVERVEVRGPAGAVGRVARVVLPVVLGDRRENFEAQFTPEARDAAGARVGAVTVEPATVGATVMVERVGRVVSVVADVAGEPPRGYRVAGTTVSPSFVTVDGPPDVLNTLIVVSTAPIEVTGRTEPFSVFDVRLVLPQNSRLVDRTTVNVQVRIEPEQQRQTVLGVAVEIINAAPGTRGVPDPGEIAVTLSGSLDRLRALNSRDIRVEVDLEGRAPGVYTLTPRVIVPADLQVADPPPAVRVRIDRLATPAPSPAATPSPTPRPTPRPTNTPPLPTPTVTPASSPAPDQVPPPPPPPPATSTPAAARPSAGFRRGQA